LNTFNIGTFYVNFQFWDALNGKLINLLPTSVVTPYKQWVQSSDAFDPRMMYMEYKLQYSNKTYSMGEFNKTTGLWDIHVPQIKLYEVVFDNYLSGFNPNISVPNGTYTQPVILPITANFIVDLSTSSVSLLNDNNDVLNIKSTPDYRVLFGGDGTGVRGIIDNKISNLPFDSARTLTIKNNGSVSVYLKNIEIVGLNQNGSTDNAPRLLDSSKNWDVNNNKTKYMFATLPASSLYFIPAAELSQSNANDALQPYFDVYYKLLPKNNRICDESDTSINWWESKRCMKWYFPVTMNTMPTWGRQFSEQLFVGHNGNDLSEILPGSNLNLELAWGLGESYSTVHLEPGFYRLINNNYMFSTGYKIDLTYTVKLYFNNSQNTLPTEENVNTKTFTIPVSFALSYTCSNVDSGGSNSFGGYIHNTV
jgi:hypothetical protein